MGARAPIILGARRAPIILGGLDEHRFLRGREHSSFREHSIRELMNEHIWIWKESQKNKFMKYTLEKWGRAPIILWGHAHSLFWGLDEHRFLRGLDEHSFLRGRKHSSFKGKQAKSNCKVDMKEKVHEMLSWKNGCARTHYFGGSTRTDYFRRARRAPILKGARALIIQRAFN